MNIATLLNGVKYTVEHNKIVVRRGHKILREKELNYQNVVDSTIFANGEFIVVELRVINGTIGRIIQVYRNNSNIELYATYTLEDVWFGGNYSSSVLVGSTLYYVNRCRNKRKNNRVMSLNIVTGHKEIVYKTKGSDDYISMAYSRGKIYLLTYSKGIYYVDILDNESKSRLRIDKATSIHIGAMGIHRIAVVKGNILKIDSVGDTLYSNSRDTILISLVDKSVNHMCKIKEIA